MSSTEAQANETRTVGLDDLRGSRGREDYDQLVIDTARLVDDGLFAVADVRPDGLTGDGEEPSEAFIQRFKDDVREELQATDSETVQATREPRQTTSDPELIDWPKLWVNAGVAATKPLSWTQAALAIDVSNQTPVDDNGATQLIEAAIEANQLQSFENRRVKPAGEQE